MAKIGETKTDHEDLNSWLETQNNWMRKAERKRKRRDWIQVGIIWAAVIILGFFVFEKAEADMLTTVHYPDLDFQEVEDC